MRASPNLFSWYSAVKKRISFRIGGYGSCDVILCAVLNWIFIADISHLTYFCLCTRLRVGAELNYSAVSLIVCVSAVPSCVLVLNSKTNAYISYRACFCVWRVSVVPSRNGGVRVEERRHVERAQQHHRSQLGRRIRGRGHRRRPLPGHSIHRPPPALPGQPRNFGEKRILYYYCLQTTGTRSSAIRSTTYFIVKSCAA